MSVTASRLSGTPLTFDWSNLANIPPSQDPRARKHEPSPSEIETAWASLKQRFESGEVSFFNSPGDPKISQINESETLASQILKQEWVEDVLFLGIGGSALGPLSLLNALSHLGSQKIRFHFKENPDPIDWKETLKLLDPEKTLVCGVTKSGGTFETVAQILCALDWLGKKRWSSHFIAITDPKKGELRELAQAEKMKMLFIDPSIGGRFSLFSPVGLFPASLSGLKVSALMKGAQKVRTFVQDTPPEKSPLFQIAAHLIAHFEQRPTHVFMPYSTPLRQIGLWWAQLWGESLGKDFKGFTPVASVGATDQHSILQLLRDGPDDKVTSFLVVDHVDEEIKIPRLNSPISGKLSHFQLLEDQSLHHLLYTEYQATSLVLTKNSRPHFTIRLDRLDEESVGALYFSLCVLTSFTGTLWGINPFDQPGVEEGKIYTRDALKGSKSS